MLWRSARRVREDKYSMSEFPGCDRRSFLMNSGTALLALGGDALQSQLGSAQVANPDPFSTLTGEPTFILQGSTLEDFWRVRRKLQPLVKSPRNPVMTKDRED